MQALVVTVVARRNNDMGGIGGSVDPLSVPVTTRCAPLTDAVTSVPSDDRRRLGFLSPRPVVIGLPGSLLHVMPSSTSPTLTRRKETSAAATGLIAPASTWFSDGISAGDLLLGRGDDPMDSRRWVPSPFTPSAGK